MAEDLVIRQELKHFASTLLGRGLPAGWVGLELMTMGMGMLTVTMGSNKMAHHLRRIADQLEPAHTVSHVIGDNGYSSIG
jgi:hypothetical protein